MVASPSYPANRCCKQQNLVLEMKRFSHSPVFWGRVSRAKSKCGILKKKGEEGLGMARGHFGFQHLGKKQFVVCGKVFYRLFKLFGPIKIFFIKGNVG